MTHAGGKWDLIDCPMYHKQTILKVVYSPNKIWSLKSLAMLKYESRTSPVVHMQYNISDRLCCFYVLWDRKPSFVLNFFSLQNQGFSYYKIVLITKECSYTSSLLKLLK